MNEGVSERVSEVNEKEQEGESVSFHFWERVTSFKTKSTNHFRSMIDRSIIVSIRFTSFTDSTRGYRFQKREREREKKGN